jgi:peptide/nickel transport system substrate-binding protein
MISYPAVSIVPEGTDRLGTHWRDGCAGTGPFRVASFEPGRQLTLERNPQYWREGVPRTESLVFRFGVTPEEIKREFLAGRLSLASDLLPADADALRQDPVYASGYREIPRLSTYMIAFNTKAGKLTDPRTRRGIASALDVPSLVRRALGRLAIPAHSLIPPGLLGYAAAAPAVPAPAASDPESLATVARESVELAAVVHPVFFGEYSALLEELTKAFREMGFVLRFTNRELAGYLVYQYQQEAIDMVIGRWDSDYPDADTFAYGVLRTEEGFVGRYVGSPALDQLADRGRAEADPSVRHSIYRQIEELIAKDTLLLPLFHEQVYRFARPEVEGLALSLSTPIVGYENLRVRR